MGPRRGGRGNLDNANKLRAELVAASMGPRRGGRGNVTVHRHPPRRTPRSSMGPRRGGRGNRSIGTSKPWTGCVLQWGHGAEAVEMSLVSSTDFWMPSLQWGHGAEAVEIMV